MEKNIYICSTCGNQFNSLKSIKGHGCRGIFLKDYTMVYKMYHCDNNPSDVRFKLIEYLQKI